MEKKGGGSTKAKPKRVTNRQPVAVNPLPKSQRVMGIQRPDSPISSVCW